LAQPLDLPFEHALGVHVVVVRVALEKTP